jgi:hypothetical protein
LQEVIASCESSNQEQRMGGFHHSEQYS